MKIKLLVAAALLTAGMVAGADTLESRLARLEAEMAQMRAESARKDAELAELRRQITARDVSPLPTGHDAAAHAPAPAADSAHGEAPTVRLAQLSAALNVTAGGGSEADAVTETLQAGGHDAHRRGFSLNQLELAVAGAVDPFFTLEGHLVLLEDDIELEEAFAVSQSLPAGLELKAGYFLTEFGLLNASHMHSWDFVDQPVVNGRLLGADGQRSAAMRLGWTMPVAWHSGLLGTVQQAEGDHMGSFNSAGGHHHGDAAAAEDLPFTEGVGGRPAAVRDLHGASDLVYTLRWVNEFALNYDLSMQAGASFSTGPNSAGVDTATRLYGADLVVTYDPEDHRGELRTPLLVWKSELIKRNFEADSAFFANDPLDLTDDFVFAADTLDDIGFYSQVVGAVHRDWSLGLRGEYATGSGASYEEGLAISRQDDPTRNDRLRISPLLIYHASNASRIRLQYNYYDADHLPSGDAHALWLSLEWLIGQHRPHAGGSCKHGHNHSGH